MLEIDLGKAELRLRGFDIGDKTATADVHSADVLVRDLAACPRLRECRQRLVAFADRAANLIYLNRAGRRMLGLNESGDLQPCKITDFLPEWAAKRVLEEGIPGAIRDRIWRGETALAGDKGQEVPLSQVIAVHCAADGSVEDV